VLAQYVWFAFGSRFGKCIKEVLSMVMVAKHQVDRYSGSPKWRDQISHNRVIARQAYLVSTISSNNCSSRERVQCKNFAYGLGEAFRHIHG